jgi:hypothetical protein
MERASAAHSQTISELAAPFGFAQGTMRACDFAGPDRCLPGCNALHRYRWRSPMTAPAERMKMMRLRRRTRGMRELRLVVADARSRAVRRRVAKQVAGLKPDRERDALIWIESVSEFDADATR